MAQAYTYFRNVKTFAWGKNCVKSDKLSFGQNSINHQNCLFFRDMYKLLKDDITYITYC